VEGLYCGISGARDFGPIKIDPRKKGWNSNLFENVFFCLVGWKGGGKKKKKKKIIGLSGSESIFVKKKIVQKNLLIKEEKPKKRKNHGWHTPQLGFLSEEKKKKKKSFFQGKNKTVIPGYPLLFWCFRPDDIK